MLVLSTSNIYERHPYIHAGTMKISNFWAFKLCETLEEDIANTFEMWQQTFFTKTFHASNKLEKHFN